MRFVIPSLHQNPSPFLKKYKNVSCSCSCFVLCGCVPLLRISKRTKLFVPTHGQSLSLCSYLLLSQLQHLFLAHSFLFLFALLTQICKRLHPLLDLPVDMHSHRVCFVAVLADRSATNWRKVGGSFLSCCLVFLVLKSVFSSSSWDTADDRYYSQFSS